MRRKAQLWQRLAQFNDGNSGKYPPIKLGYEIHTGLLTVGTVGEPKRMEATVISDTVNTASRLEVMIPA